MIVYGIDPGFKGAIAIFYPKSGFLEVHDMPVFASAAGRTEINHHALLDVLACESGGLIFGESGGDTPATVWLEQVSARPGQGVTSMFRFGQGYGAIEMACAATGSVLRYVTPGKWKKHFGVSSDKGGTRAVACQRFPDKARLFARVKDDGRAEAALIALYGAEMTP